MKFNIHGSKIKITEPIKNYIEEKIGRLDKYFSNPDSLVASVLIRIRGIEQIIEVTIPVKHIILRGETCDKDLYTAIDLVSEKIESQIRKNKTRMHHKKIKPSLIEFNLEFDVKKEELENNKVVKRKLIEMKPMSEEEAILQMNLLGHDFFLFRHDKNGKKCVIYRRTEGNYGLLIANED